MKRNKTEENGVGAKHNKTEDKNGTSSNGKGSNSKGTAEQLYQKFKQLKHKAVKDGLSKDEVCNVFRGKKSEEGWVLYLTVPQFVGLALTVAVIVMATVAGLMRYFKLDEEIYYMVKESRCAVENNGIMIEVARPKTNCRMCQDLRSVPIETTMTPEEFAQKYAYTAVPVLIKEATRNWTAMNKFSFHFFQELYVGTEGALEKNEEDCQFFPYKTEFHTLADVFNMSDERAGFKEGEKPWYVGWSNCHNEVAKVLRQHYERPYFIPKESESSSIDWIFMGGSGLGAFIHLDYVQRPSWQAQILGKKTWTIIPTPECEHVCSSMNVTVSKGDILVIDTNQWYHATYIHPGEISITIGSEYD